MEARGVDVDQITAELYGMKPSEFIAARDAYAAQARAAGDKQTARRITELRRPTLAAWAANLLARNDSDETERFLRLGQALREAHRTLDPARLRELSHQQHQVITTLARSAVTLAEEAGQPVTEGVHQEVERTLRAVLADPATAEAWAAGCLVKAGEASIGFAGLEPEVAPHRSATTRRTAPDGTDTGSRKAPSAPATGSVEKKKERARREAARKAARTAATEAGQKEHALRAAGQEHERATTRLADAEERLATLRTQLDQAREDRTAARSRANETAKRVRTAEKEAKAARRAADVATRAVDTTGDIG
ncbi:hypothetical protein [Streptomyces sp. NPDC059256]|uniref:hypothetical protein n=1 Tax=Streptomyces sp. NPDC059256 TaxID=3346794 RepID=UPI003687481B